MKINNHSILVSQQMEICRMCMHGVGQMQSSISIYKAYINLLVCGSLGMGKPQEMCARCIKSLCINS
ncbi:hypothetical protein AB205_0131650 [Aquarana catesbeiana]|uniref:Uncharacterized protein n=1 Tax=Aquarana catesbeiana TaxID=8400 RepID=A0A2G9QER8_AQUCT|nr:hypothetical protein AB205_0131650 [Aquarana catesbeiana]